MWKWIKKLFRPWKLNKVSPDITSVKPKVDLTGLTKGDIKKLKKQGKCEFPFFHPVTPRSQNVFSGRYTLG